MATWTASIPIDTVHLNSKQANISATRTEGSDVRTFSLPRVSLDTHDKPGAEILADTAAALYAEFIADNTKNANIAELLSNYEALLATALNAMEP